MNDDNSEVDETLKVVFLGDSGRRDSCRCGKDNHSEQIHPEQLRAIHPADCGLDVFLQKGDESR